MPSKITPFNFKELKPKRNKYGNRKIVYMQMEFDSILERDRYLVLKDAERRGDIADLRRQDPVTLIAHGVEICVYIADHSYTRNGTRHFEDCKGMREHKSKRTGKVTRRPFLTPEAALKKRLFEAQTGTKLFIVTKENLHELP